VTFVRRLGTAEPARPGGRAAGWGLEAVPFFGFPAAAGERAAKYVIDDLKTSAARELPSQVT
jgi:hypothetical protein